VATTILLARHGETDWNREGRWQGWADPSLNGTGHDQARELAATLAGTHFDAVYSSDLRRALETAEILASPHDLPVVTDPGLREIDVGPWSGLTRAEITERFPLGNRPGGETREEHSARVLASVERIARAHPAGRILIVAHGGCLRALQRHLADDVSHPIPNCSVYEIHFADDGFLPV
jgi:broad specificity phosphatase PhoE